MRATLLAATLALSSTTGCAVLGLRVPCDSDAACPSEQPFCVDDVCAALPAEGEGEGEGEGEPANACGLEVPPDLGAPLVAAVNLELEEPLPAGCFATIEEAVSAAGEGGGAVLVGAGVFRESWPIMVPAGLTLFGAGRDRTLLEVSTESSVLVLADGVTLEGVGIVRTAAQTPLPLVDIQGAAVMHHLKLSGSQALLATAGEGLHLQDVVFNGAIVGSLFAGLNKTVMMQSCVIEAGELLLDGPGDIEIRDTQFTVAGDDDLRSIATGNVRLERVEISAAAGVDHLVALEAGAVLVRASTFRAPSATTALVLARGSVTSLDLGTDGEDGDNTFEAPAGRADLMIDLPSGTSASLVTAAGNTWSSAPPRCGHEIRFGSAGSVGVQLDGDATCETTISTCGSDVPTYREVPFAAAVGPGASADGCYPSLDLALASLGARSDVGIYVAAGTHSTPAVALATPGLLLEGAAGAELMAAEGTLLTVTQPVMLRTIRLVGGLSYGIPLLTVLAPTVVEGCTFYGVDTAVDIRGSGTSSVDIHDSTFDAGVAVIADVDDGDIFRFRNNLVDRGGFFLQGNGGAEVVDNTFLVKDTEPVSLAAEGAVDFFDNTVRLRVGEPCGDAVLVRRGGVTFRNNHIGDQGPTLACAAIALRDLGPVTVDLGTLANPGDNFLRGDPDLLVDLTNSASTERIAALGNTWSTDPTPSCRADDNTADINILTSAHTVVVDLDDGDTCP